jgi:hypothetical protein
MWHVTLPTIVMCIWFNTGTLIFEKSEYDGSFYSWHVAAMCLVLRQNLYHAKRASKLSFLCDLVHLYAQ